VRLVLAGGVERSGISPRECVGAVGRCSGGHAGREGAEGQAKCGRSAPRRDNTEGTLRSWKMFWACRSRGHGTDDGQSTGRR
jgi:hypothetical protein